MGTGCGTIPSTYVPQALGPVRSGTPVDGLEMTIRPHSETIRMGQDLVFAVTLTNVGTQEIQLPVRPQLVFYWTYSNGTRDNYVLDLPTTRFYRDQDLRQLAPRDSLEVEYHIETGYFPRPGITEFRAVARAARNTNPEVGNVWQGKTISNGYGVLVQDGSDSPRNYARNFRTSAR